MKYDYSEASTLELAFDDSTHELIVPEGIVVEESLVRRLKDMRPLFKNADNCDDETPLYYMYNGIYRSEHKNLFDKAKIKYEYTILLPLLINGECVKAHGHVHGISPISKTNYLEAYEVLDGEGYFELFRFNGEECEVLFISVKKGDFVMIPPGYYHLSINTGDRPFNFGDLIVFEPNSDYSLLKEYDGAPFYCLKDEKGNISFELNERYKDKKIRISHVDVDHVPWDIPLAKVPLYAQFVANPAYFDYLK